MPLSLLRGDSLPFLFKMVPFYYAENTLRSIFPSHSIEMPKFKKKAGYSLTTEDLLHPSLELAKAELLAPPDARFAPFFPQSIIVYQSDCVLV